MYDINFIRNFPSRKNEVIVTQLFLGNAKLNLEHLIYKNTLGPKGWAPLTRNRARLRIVDSGNTFRYKGQLRIISIQHKKLRTSSLNKAEALQ